METVQFELVVPKCEHESDPSRNISCADKTVPVNHASFITFFKLTTSATLKPQYLKRAKVRCVLNKWEEIFLTMYTR